MFNLTLHDHLQLTFTDILQRHNAHAAKAAVAGAMGPPAERQRSPARRRRRHRRGRSGIRARPGACDRRRLAGRPRADRAAGRSDIRLRRVRARARGVRRASLGAARAISLAPLGSARRRAQRCRRAASPRQPDRRAEDRLRHDVGRSRSRKIWRRRPPPAEEGLLRAAAAAARDIPMVCCRQERRWQNPRIRTANASKSSAG